MSGNRTVNKDAPVQPVQFAPVLGVLLLELLSDAVKLLAA
jgi:hypothetical protein